jgi:hypothetical protein
LFLSRATSLSQHDSGIWRIDADVDLIYIKPGTRNAGADIGLFWWSAKTISTFMPLAAAPKSSTDRKFGCRDWTDTSIVGIKVGHVGQYACGTALANCLELAA